jgi:hypothetical protein
MAGRRPELSEKLHRLIWDLWVYKGMGTEQIANHINSDTALKSEFGEISSQGVYYHIVHIRDELEKTVNEDALDSYVGEFIRAKEGLDSDIEAIQKLIDNEQASTLPNKDILLKLMKLKHDVKVDRFRLLQDVELPIRVKKLKRERERMVGTVPVAQLEVNKDERISEQGNTEDSSISNN